MTELGRVDVVVNNAATNQPYGPLMDADPEAWRTAFAVNVEAPLRLVQCAWRAWMGEHGGAVVNVCTEGAAHVGPHVGAYGTSKAALLHPDGSTGRGTGPVGAGQLGVPGLVRTEMARFVWETAGGDGGGGGCPRAGSGAGGRGPGGALAGVGRGVLDHRRGPAGGRRHPGARRLTDRRRARRAAAAASPLPRARSPSGKTP